MQRTKDIMGYCTMTKTNKYEARLSELQHAVQAAREELDAFEQKHDTLLAKQYVGKCYRYMNSYSSTEVWPLYIRVLAATDRLHIVEFERRSNDEFELSSTTAHAGRLQSAAYEEITPYEFNAAYRKFCKEMNAQLIR